MRVSLFAVAAIAALTSTDAFVTKRSPGALSSAATLTTRRFLSSNASTASTTEAPVTASPQQEETIYNYTPEFDAAVTHAIQLLEENVPSEKMLQPLVHFCKEFFLANQDAFEAGSCPELSAPQATLKRFMTGIQYGQTFGMGPDKFMFGSFHKAFRGKGDDGDGFEDNDIDFYTFGNDFFRPTMNLKKSKVLGRNHFEEAMGKLRKGENVIFFANHQSEADPQVMSVLMEQLLEGMEEEAPKVTFVAGHKVTTDPLAIPFSMGRNLICIHSKKHISADPETKGLKQKQNLASMSAMLGLLRADEGACIWVAPSGGRDRRDLETGKVPIAPFDRKTIDMFRLMGNKSKKPTHYYPLSMVSYDLCPPPDYVVAGVGEQRNVRFVPVGISCGAELSSRGGLESRQEFCRVAEECCREKYEALVEAIENE